MDIVTLGAALNGSVEYVNSHFKGGSNIQIVDNPDGTQTINASGEVSSEDTVARADIAAIKDGETLDSFGDVETALATKANSADVYTKTVVDTALSAKANSADVYSKSDIDTAMSAKADKSTTYTKTEVDTALSGKVDKETGKGLSTNDYTDTEKAKLAGIEAQANKTTVDDSLSGSSTNPVQNKVVKTALDGKANASTTYTKTEVDTALSGKQATLTTAQLAAVNSGITSADVAQITTNKNNISKDKAALVEIVDSGAKNRLNYNIATFGDKSKVTINQDGSITGSITSDARQYTWSNREFEFTLSAGDYVLCIKRLSGSNVYTSARLMTAENNNICSVATNPNIAPSTKSFTLDTDTTIGFIGKVFTDTIQLMLCTKAAWDISQTYQPYRPSYWELYERVVALEQANQ